MYRGFVERPKASLSAVYIAPDGTKVDLGVLAGEGRDNPANLEKGKAARKAIDKMTKKDQQKEVSHGG